jgi:hypothetical protein
LNMSFRKKERSLTQGNKLERSYLISKCPFLQKENI